MVKLNQSRYDLIHHILESIAICEGGHVETITTEDGDITLQLITDIPPEYWCDKCKKRIICKAKLMARWVKIKTL